MGIIIFANDLHMTTDLPARRGGNIEEDSLRKFEFMIAHAAKRGATVIISGDICDKPRDWWLMPEIAEVIERYKVTVYASVGQHDSYYYDKNSIRYTSLGMLAQSRYIRFLGPDDSFKPIYDLRNRLIARVFGIWYSPKWIGDLQHLCRHAPKKVKGVKDILSAHIPVGVKGIKGSNAVYPAQEVFDSCGFFDVISVGDIHESFMLTSGEGFSRRYMLNTGPMMRLEFNEFNKTHKPFFFVYNTDSNEIISVKFPARPASEIFTERRGDKDRGEVSSFVTDLVETLKERMDENQRDPIKLIREFAAKVDLRGSRRLARTLREILEEAGF